MSNKVSVLMVCMGNICRSPTAQGVLEAALAARGLSHCVRVDSAGTHAYHVGEAPDRRARAAAENRGIDIHTQRARRVTVEDFERFDYVLAMDEENLQSLRQICPQGLTHRLALFMDFAEGWDATEVPDPYYGAEDGFEAVLDMTEAAAQGLIAAIERGQPA